MQILSQNIRFLRTHFNLTQEQMADICNASRGMIDTYERQKAVPPLERLIEIRNHFKLTLDSLVFVDISKNTHLLGIEPGQNDPIILKDELIAGLRKQISLYEQIIASHEKTIIELKKKKK